MNDTVEDALRSQLQECVEPIGEATSSELHAVLRAGRTKVRRHDVSRRVAAAAGTLAIAATGSVAVLSGGTASATEWTLASSLRDVNPRILAILKENLPSGTHLRRVTMKAYAADPATVGDPTPLPRRDWDRAVTWEVTADLGGGHIITVRLLHAKGETEGDTGGNCDADVAAGYVSSCQVTIASAQGTTVPMLEQTSVALVKRPDGTLETGAVANDKPGDDVNPHDVSSYIRPERRYFEHSVEVHPGDEFLVSVDEQIKTPDLRGFADAAALDTESMEEMVLSPELLAAG